MRSVLKEIKVSSVMLLMAGSALLAFGLYNVHSISNVTEGGILGLDLASGILVWNLTIIFRVSFDSFVLSFGLEDFRETISCIFLYFSHRVFRFLWNF